MKKKPSSASAKLDAMLDAVWQQHFGPEFYAEFERRCLEALTKVRDKVEDTDTGPSNPPRLN